MIQKIDLDQTPWRINIDVNIFYLNFFTFVAHYIGHSTRLCCMLYPRNSLHSLETFENFNIPILNRNQFILWFQRKRIRFSWKVSFGKYFSLFWTDIVEDMLVQVWEFSFFKLYQKSMKSKVTFKPPHKNCLEPIENVPGAL